jgi:acyl-coenzyme A thioesterase PaaI-like protein
MSNTPLSLRQRLLMRLVNFYPPYLGAGIRVVSVAPDWSAIKVRLGLTWFNRNLFGTQFGGSLYAMCDPFFVIILLRQLGPGYYVWDKAACIQFRRPGRGPVTATFHIPPERVKAIRALADQGEKVEPVFQVDVMDEEGQVIAQVEKRLWVRKKASPPTPALRATPPPSPDETSGEGGGAGGRG